jgi:redox-sensing transcriptional repressor
MDIKSPLSVSQPTVRRLPLYLRILKQAEDAGKENISSTYIAKELKLESIQVRKDLASMGITGQPGIGFTVKSLIRAIEHFLGWDNPTDAFVVGAGNLGAALAGYEGFGEYNLNIIAAFDIDPAKVGSEISGKKVFHIAKLAEHIQRMHIKIAILTLPSAAAQQITNIMVEAGIKAIWNFTSLKLNVPEDVFVERIDLAASLAVLSNKISIDSEKVSK